MKKNILLAACLLFANLVFGQVKPIYFDGDKITADSTRATSYAVYGKLSTEDLWVFKRYDLYNNLIQTGSYKDSVLTIPHGKFVFYNYIEDFNYDNKENFKAKGKLLFVAQIGNFYNGVEQGRWMLFYPDGSPLSVQDFLNGKLNGEFKNYDKYGNTIVYGKYDHNERDGEWVFVKEGKTAIYDHGTLLSTDLIPKNKSLKKQ